MPIGSVDWIADGMLRDRVSIRSDHSGAIIQEVELRNQFFHGSHPLGWIRSLSLSVDGTAVPEDELWLVLRGQPFPVSALRQISDVWWHPLEVALLRWKGAHGSHELELVCDVRVSTFFFTPIVDLDDIYPTMHLRLSRTAQVIQGAPS